MMKSHKPQPYKLQVTKPLISNFTIINFPFVQKLYNQSRIEIIHHEIILLQKVHNFEPK